MKIIQTLILILSAAISIQTQAENRPLQMEALNFARDLVTDYSKYYKENYNFTYVINAKNRVRTVSSYSLYGQTDSGIDCQIELSIYSVTASGVTKSDVNPQDFLDIGYAIRIASRKLDNQRVLKQAVVSLKNQNTITEMKGFKSYQRVQSDGTALKYDWSDRALKNGYKKESASFSIIQDGDSVLVSVKSEYVSILPSGEYVMKETEIKNCKLLKEPKEKGE